MPRVSVSLPSGDPYANPELFRWAGSMEGVPEWIDPAESQSERLERGPWQEQCNRWFELAGQLLPGVVVAFVLAGLGREAAGLLSGSLFGLERSPISPILLAVALGLLIRNTIGLPAVYEAGLQLCLKRILRIGVALLGIRLSLGAAGAIGLQALPIVVASITTALVFVAWVNRSLGLPRRLGTLVAVGTAICGNSAIVATGPVIRASEEEISYAVGCITVFGLIALVGYPFLAFVLFDGDPRSAGLFLGTAIHDTAQVVGAGLLYSQQFGAESALDIATVTKLLRNMFMVVVIPAMALVYHRSGERGTGSTPRFSQVVPLFVLGFVAMAGVRTLGDFGGAPFGGRLAPDTWQNVIEGLSLASAWCLTVAMASVGLGTHLGRLRTLGWKPLGVGLAAALSVGGVSAGLILLLV